MCLLQARFAFVKQRIKPGAFCRLSSSAGNPEYYSYCFISTCFYSGDRHRVFFILLNMTTYKSSKLFSVEHSKHFSSFNFQSRNCNWSVIRYKMASYLSALSSIVIITLLLSVVHHSGASWGWGCRGPKNEGTRFGKPKRMWWYNSETDQCEAFTYLGSGGNANRHP